MNSVPDEAGWVLDEFDAPRFWGHVDFNGGRAYQEDPLVDLDRVDGDCWLWSGWNSDGYGSFRVWGRIVVAHRIAYRDLGHDLAETQDLDHLCRIHACVRADHLEPVTHAENILRGRTSLASQRTIAAASAAAL